MKRVLIYLYLIIVSVAVMAQDSINVVVDSHNHSGDSTDVFFRHLSLNEVVVTGVTGDTKLKNATTPVTVVSARDLRATPATNIIDAISLQPGVAQLTTGGGISKPIIRGLGYNRVVVISEGVRQEGQQWGDEHGVEVDGNAVSSVEIIKGPASLMYGSDAMAGVVILHSRPTAIDGTVNGSLGSEYQTNNGLFSYTLSLNGNQRGFVWDGGYSGKMAHAYKNKYDGYVPGSQFREQAGRLMLGVNKRWGHSRLTWTAYHLTPGIVEGERDPYTGELISATSDMKTYGKTLPFQQVKHYKLVWDNSLYLSSGYLKALVGYQQNRRQEYEESADEYELFLKTHTLTYDVRYVTNDFNGWKLSAGVGGMYQRADNKGEERLIPDYRLFDAGFYTTASKTMRNWTMNGGLRIDHRRIHSLGDKQSADESGERGFTDFHSHYTGVTGSLGAVWNASDNINMRFNIARGFRTPNMSELASNGVHEGSIRYEIGDRHLKSEYSLQADLGMDYTSRYVSAQLALFANTIDNYIFTRRLTEEIEPGYLTYAYTQGDARLLGFEVGLDIHPFHSLHFENTFSYVYARLLHQPSDTRYLPYTPAPRWTSELKWELSHHSHSTLHHTHGSNVQGRLKPRLNNLFIALSTECYLRQNHIYRLDDTETPTPGYMLINISSGTDLNIRGKKVAELHVAANNLFNRCYQNHLSRLKYADINTVTGRQGVFNMGRNITLKLVVPFSFTCS